MTKDFISFKNVDDIQSYIDLVSLEIYNKYKYSKFKSFLLLFNGIS